MVEIKKHVLNKRVSKFYQRLRILGGLLLTL
jgi:hypothetical protein